MLTDSVAEVGVALILASLRQTVSRANQVRSGQWTASTELFSELGQSLLGQTVGFIGLGRIGLAIALRLIPFKINPTVYYSNRTDNTEAARYEGAEASHSSQLSFRLLPGLSRVSLAQLAAVSDIVVVAASLSQETKNIVSAEFLGNMKSSAFLINIARGGLVDQEALVTALTTGGIKGRSSPLSS